jgi:hypothetical protein
MAGSVGYRVLVRVQGCLDPAWWSAMFEHLAVTDQPDGTTLVSGEVADQAAVHGLLAAIRDLGLSLVSVETVVNRAADRGAA